MPLKLSFISLCYNHAAYVREHMDAVYALSRDKSIELQWIIVDDCSQDDSAAIIEKWISERNPPSVHFIRHERNEGVSKSLNDGLKRAEGDFVKILATDDYVLREAMLRQVKDLAGRPPVTGLSCSNFIRLLPDGSRLPMYSEAYSFSRTPYLDLLRLEAAFIHSATLIYRREVFQLAGNFNESLKQEDYDMLLRITKRFQLHYFEEATVVKRELPASLGAAMFRIERYNREVLHVLRAEEPAGKSEEMARYAGICKWGMNYLSNEAAGYEGFTLKNFRKVFSEIRHPLIAPAALLSGFSGALAYRYLKWIRNGFIKREKS